MLDDLLDGKKSREDRAVACFSPFLDKTAITSSKVVQAKLISAALTWMEHVGVKTIDLAAKNYVAGSFIPPTAPRTASVKVTEVVPILHNWMSRLNAHGFNILFRPSANSAWPIIFLDDIPIDRARAAIQKFTSLAIATSPNNTQVWIKTAVSLTSSERGMAQRRLIQALGLGDPGSSSGSHFGRLPGFKNQKPGRNNWTTIVGSGHTLPAIDLISQPTKGAARGHLPELATLIPSELPHAPATRARFNAISSMVSSSEHEFGIACGMLLRGRSENETVDEVYRLALARNKYEGRSASILKYATRTVNAAKARVKSNQCP